MFEFGDEVTIESYRILPWLIWIQILVMLLLVLLLCCFSSLFPLDFPGSGSYSPASPSLCPESHIDKKPVFNHTTTSLVSTCIQASQVGEQQSIKGEISTGTNKRIVRGENSVEKEGCSSMEGANQNFYHPCHYLGLAKLAFLKCLGLDSLFESSSKTTDQKKQR